MLPQQGLQGQEQERLERRQRIAQCDTLLTLGELSGCCLWGDQCEGQVYSRRARPWKRQPQGLEVAHEDSGTLIVGATPGSLAGWGGGVGDLGGLSGGGGPELMTEK